MAKEAKRDSDAYSKKMADSKNELAELQNELNSLFVRFVLRALRVYQSTRPEALRPNEVALLVKNEINNVLADLNAQPNIDAMAKKAKEEWAKESKQ